MGSYKRSKAVLFMNPNPLGVVRLDGRGKRRLVVVLN